MTNFEKIKSMSKEELSKFIVEGSICECCVYTVENCLLGDCYKGVEQWLESEVKDDD